MVDIAGVASTANQLATTCSSIAGLLKRINRASSTLQNYHQQLQQIGSLSTAISLNPLLQTSEIQTLTSSLHKLISKTNLDSILRRNSLIRTIYLLQKEKDLCNTLASVERQKVNLGLTIEHIQAQALFRIQTDINNMASQSKAKVAESTKPSAPGSDSFSPQSSKPIENTQSLDSRAMVPTVADSLQYLNTQNDMFTQTDYTTGHGCYTDNIANEGVTQINGSKFIGSMNALNHVQNSSLWLRNKKIGPEPQLNQSRVDTYIDTTGLGQEPVRLDAAQFSGNYVGNIATGVPSSNPRDSPAGGTQVNGLIMQILDGKKAFDKRERL